MIVSQNYSRLCWKRRAFSSGFIPHLKYNAWAYDPYKVYVSINFQVNLLSQFSEPFLYICIKETIHFKYSSASNNKCFLSNKDFFNRSEMWNCQIHPQNLLSTVLPTQHIHLSVSPQVIYGVKCLGEWGQQALALVGGHMLQPDSSSWPPAPFCSYYKTACSCSIRQKQWVSQSRHSPLYCALQLKERWDGARHSLKLAKTNQDSPPFEQIWTLCQHPAVGMWRRCSVDHQLEALGWMRMNLAWCSAW